MKRAIALKGLIIGIAACMASTSLLAVVLIVFHGWQPLLNDSPDIVIVRCLETPRGLTRMPDGTLGEISDGIYEVKVETE
jgi:hypothetical protein